MRLELTRVGLLVQLANHYTTRGAIIGDRVQLSKTNDTRKEQRKKCNRVGEKKKTGTDQQRKTEEKKEKKRETLKRL